MITTILFDLDGTLLPMDQERFVKSYLERMAKKLAPQGYDPKLLIDGCERLDARPGDRIVCRLAPCTTDFVKTNEMSFYRRLRTKMAHRG